jgi:hypothetical protein
MIAERNCHVRRNRKMWATWFLAPCVSFILSTGAAHAVGTWTDPYCRQGDECQQYVPACMECKNVGNGPECKQVAEGETGYPNCTNVYQGAQAIYCSATGGFCSQITVIF